MHRMSWKPKEFEYPREIVRWVVVASIFNLLLGIVIVWTALPLTDSHAYWGVGLGIGIGLLGLGLLLYLAKWQRHSVAINRHGLTVNDGPLVPWGKIQNIRTRSFLQRAELIGVNGDVLVKLDYQLEGIDSLIREILKRLPSSSDPSTRRFHSNAGYIPIAFMVLFSAGVVHIWISSSGDELLAILFLLGCCVAALIASMYSLIFSLEITSRGLVLKRLLRTETLKFRAIHDLDLVIKYETHGGPRRAVVRITLRDGREMDICPFGYDPFDLFQQLKPLIRKRG